MITDSYTFATLRNEASSNFGLAPEFSEEALEFHQSQGPNTDWLDVIFKPGSITQHTLSLDGGNDQTTYRVSFGYLDEDGTVLATGANRINTRVNLDTKPIKKLTVSTSLALSKGNRFSSHDDIGADAGSPLWDAVEATPMFPAYDSQGRIARAHPNISGASLGNPLQAIEGSKFKERSFDLLGNVGLEYQPIDGLSLSANAAINYRTFNQSRFSPSYSIYDFVTGEEFEQNVLRGAGRGYGESQNTTYILKASYEKQLGGNYFKVLAGFNQEESNTSFFNAGRSGFLSNSTRVLNVGDPSTATNQESATTWALRSYFARVNYNFNEKYLFEANIRVDGTSRFQNNKWGVFPSFSGAWVASKETFFTSLKNTVDFLKVRASWGQLGNQFANTNGDDFAYARQLSLNQNYNFGGTIVAGVAQTTLGNADLTWETTTVTNVGLDIGIFNSSVTLTGDYFIRNTDNILFDVPVSPLTGFTTQIRNSAKVQNKGWELGLQYDNTFGNFNFSIGGNVTHVTSEVIHIDPNAEATGDRFIYGVENRRVVQRGSPLNALYGVEVEGIFQSVEEVNSAPDHKVLNANFGPGDLRLKDANNDGRISNDDRVVIGKEDPTWIYGINLRAGYKGFDISALFNGAADMQAYASEEVARPFFSNAGTESRWLNRWTPDNTNTNIPRLFFTNGPSTSINNSFWVNDRSYFRMKNLQIGFTLPATLLDRAKIQKVRFYVNGSNLFTITKFPYFDPERPSGRDRGQEGFPQLKVYSAGVNLTF
jgi:TonB-linked SusC/RagA family outer membrane protein